MTKSNGICSHIKKGDKYFLCLTEQVDEGDYIAFNGEHVRARAVSEDSRKCNGISHKKPFKRNHKPQILKILKIVFQGRILTLKKENVKYTGPIKVCFLSKGKQNIGHVTLRIKVFVSTLLDFLHMT